MFKDTSSERRPAPYVPPIDNDDDDDMPASPPRTHTTVRSRPIRAPRWTPSGADTMRVAGQVGIIGAAVTFGGIIWAINGGFSVIGLETVSKAFNEEGAIFWGLMSSITFTLPIPESTPELQAFAVQPLLPWIGVIAASLVQIAVSYLSLTKGRMPIALIVFAIILGLYDLGTTFFGLSTVPWASNAGWIVQFILATAITFSVEITFGYILRTFKRR